MPKDPAPFVDLHLHAEGLRDADLTTLSLFGLSAAVTCANDAGASSAEEVRVPWHGLDDLLHRLPRYFDDPRVAAIGEVGLQEGSSREEEVLIRQLELAAQLRKPVIAHTPAAGKLSVTKRLLAILRESRAAPG